MNALHTRIQALVAKGSYAISEHAYEEAQKDAILPLDIVTALQHSNLVEDYPDAKRGPSILVFGTCSEGRPIHAVWGTHNSNPGKAVLITAYRPDPTKWTSNFLERLK